MRRVYQSWKRIYMKRTLLKAREILVTEKRRERLLTVFWGEWFNGFSRRVKLKWWLDRARRNLRDKVWIRWWGLFVKSKMSRVVGDEVRLSKAFGRWSGYVFGKKVHFNFFILLFYNFHFIRL